jgi:hypothetical protein
MYGKILIGLFLLMSIASGVSDETIIAEVSAGASGIGVSPSVLRINENSWGSELLIIVYDDAVTQSGQGPRVASDLLTIGQTVSMNYPERKIKQVYVAVTCTANNIEQGEVHQCEVFNAIGSGSSLGQY